MIGTTRITIVVPAAGVIETYELAGEKIITEKTPVSTPEGVPVIRVGGNGGPLPAYGGSRYDIDGGFRRLGIEGTTESAGENLYLLIANTRNIKIEMPGTVE